MLHNLDFSSLVVFLALVSGILPMPPMASAAQLTLSWNDNSDNETGFTIERRVGTSGNYQQLVSVGSDVTSYADADLSSSTTYCYRVMAFNPAGNSSYSNENCATTSASTAPPPATAPPPSSNTASTNIADGAVLSGASVTWTATASGTPVRVEFLIDGTLSWTELVAVYQYNSDPAGRLDTTKLSNGSHQLTVRAVYSDNSTAVQTVTVTVTNGSSTQSFTLTAATAGSGGGTAVTANFLNSSTDKVGVYRPSTGEWFLDNGNGSWDGCGAEICVNPFGDTSDLPLAGRWTVGGPASIGLFRPQEGGWFIDLNANETWDGCDPDVCLGSWGEAGDLPFSGDWNGTGTSKIGVFRPSTGEWFLDFNGNGMWDGCSTEKCFTFSNYQAGDLPIAGDWTGRGTTQLGFFRPSTGEWFLDGNANRVWDGCTTDICVTGFGVSGDRPVAGDWNGTGTSKIGLFRPGTGEWFLDLNGNGKWDGATVDMYGPRFGEPEDIPISGAW